MGFARLAVGPLQILEWGLPTRPAKTTDTRSARFAGESVEVDAIPAPMLRTLVEDAITRYLDPDALALHRVVEAEERAGLAALVGGWAS